MLDQAGVYPKGTVSLADVIQNTKDKGGFRNAGAVATFTGVVRGITAEGEKVQKLEIEAYDEKAHETLTNICADLMKRKGILDVQIHHLLGQFEVGEDLVYVLVAGSHRKQVFSVLEEAVERYKKEAPVFKKEYVETIDGRTKSTWISERKDSSRV